MSDQGATCPECGEPVSPTASYCMHCYADLDDVGLDETDAAGASATVENESDPSPAESIDLSTGERLPTSEDGVADADQDRAGEQEAGFDASTDVTHTDESADGVGAIEGLLDPEGAADATLTVIVAIAGSIVIGIFGTVALLVVTGSVWALPVGVLAWLVSLALLARQYSVQAALGKTFYGFAAVLLVLPFAAAGPSYSGDLESRVLFFSGTLMFFGFLAALAAGTGYAILQFAPEPE